MANCDINQFFKMMHGFANSGLIIMDENLNFKVPPSSEAFQPIMAAFEALKPEKYYVMGKYARDIVREESGKIAIFFCDRRDSIIPRVLFSFVSEFARD